jgi:DNA-directed RNA polymerase specialized sigma24 family protein
MSQAQSDSSATGDLLDRIRSGDRHALDDVLRRERSALRAFVDRHLDPRLRARIDPSDVVQDTQLEIMRRIDDFLDRRPMPFRLWTRKQAYERMLRLRRDHVTHRRRSVTREVAWPEQSSLLIARPFVRYPRRPAPEPNPANSPAASAQSSPNSTTPTAKSSCSATPTICPTAKSAACSKSIRQPRVNATAEPSSACNGSCLPKGCWSNPK